MAYNPYIARRCPFCNYRRQISELTDQFYKHRTEAANPTSPVCRGSGLTPAEARAAYLKREEAAP